MGLMNEFKWSSKYSRSIGVDIRYALWLIWQVDGASALLEEMLGAEGAAALTASASASSN